MRKINVLVLFFAMLFLILSSVDAQNSDEVSTLYGETYMCGDSFSVSIVSQPLMVSQTTEKLMYCDYYFNEAKGKNVRVQYVIDYGDAKGDEVLLSFRLKIRNINPVTIAGLAPESFLLTGQVRDRIFSYKPEVIMPYEADQSLWAGWLMRKGYTVYSLSNNPDEFQMLDVQDFEPYYYSKVAFKPLRSLDIRLIYRVKPFLINWKMVIDPQDAGAFDVDGEAGLKPCSLTFRFPAVKNEITNEVYKYLY